MNKIAAYEIALEIVGQEKRAEYLIDAYGTCDGYMPEPYLHAFDNIEMDKEAILTSIGRGITGMARRAGQALSGSGGRAAMRSINEGKGLARSGGYQAGTWGGNLVGGRRAQTGVGLQDAARKIYNDPNATKMLGGAALGAGTIGLGAGVLGGRATK